MSGQNNLGRGHLGLQPSNISPQPWKPQKQGQSPMEQFGGRGLRNELMRLSDPLRARMFNPFVRGFRQYL